jgi:hypothetical protein
METISHTPEHAPERKAPPLEAPELATPPASPEGKRPLAESVHALEQLDGLYAEGKLALLMALDGQQPAAAWSMPVADYMAGVRIPSPRGDFDAAANWARDSGLATETEKVEKHKGQDIMVLYASQNPDVFPQIKAAHQVKNHSHATALQGLPQSVAETMPHEELDMDTIEAPDEVKAFVRIVPPEHLQEELKIAEARAARTRELSPAIYALVMQSYGWRQAFRKMTPEDVSPFSGPLSGYPQRATPVPQEPTGAQDQPPPMDSLQSAVEKQPGIEYIKAQVAEQQARMLQQTAKTAPEIAWWRRFKSLFRRKR